MTTMLRNRVLTLGLGMPLLLMAAACSNAPDVIQPTPAGAGGGTAGKAAAGSGGKAGGTAGKAGDGTDAGEEDDASAR
jgi:hypothetical protein